MTKIEVKSPDLSKADNIGKLSTDLLGVIVSIDEADTLDMAGRMLHLVSQHFTEIDYTLEGNLLTVTQISVPQLVILQATLEY